MPQANPRSIAVAVTTYYPNWYKGKLKSIKNSEKVRGDLALEFIKKASDSGFQVVITDGKSSTSFKRELKKIPNIHTILKRSAKRSPAKRHAFKVASHLEDIKVIVATEPEKLSVLDSIEKITAPILENKTDIVVPKRNDKLFAQSYPDYMYQSETEGNKTYNEFLKVYGILKEDQNLDFFFGPRAFSTKKEVLACFMRKFTFKSGKTNFPKGYFDPEEYSNSGYFPVILALKKGLGVKSIEIPFLYPKIQKQNEETGAREFFLEKRKSQRLSLILDLVLFLTYLKK